MYRVAIIGRPNVGKSTLFNRLTGTRKAIVGNEPGITRDRLSETAVWNERRFEVIDTGGISPDAREVIPEMILQQADIAIQEADLILFVVDARQGITPLDEQVNAMVRAQEKEYLLVANKVDVDAVEPQALQFYALGVSSLFPVSAEHNLGIADLVEEVLKRIPESEERMEEEEIRVAIIGRPNVGKSSLLNRILGQERTIVTDIPGTTRDAVDSLVKADGRRFRLIDTAGIRRKGKTRLMAEKLCVVMARKNLERADVVLLVIDASEGATKLDATIGGYAHDAGKSVILVVNKWDLVSRDTHTAASLEKEFRLQFRFLDYAPMIFVSAKTGLRARKVLDLVREASEARLTRIPTSELNRFLESEVQPFLRSRSREGKFPVKYFAQVAVAPPTFVCFTRTARKLHFSVERFLINRLRKRAGFYATPIRLVQRGSRWKGRQGRG